MALPKKHYELIARQIKTEAGRAREGWQHDEDKSLDHLENLADDLAIAFVKDNPQFDRARFLAACGF